MKERSTFSAYGGRARWATVSIETEASTYLGCLFIPETKKRCSDVLADERPFINLIEVSMNGSEEIEPFVAINKRFIKTVRILQETAGARAAEETAVRGRQAVGSAVDPVACPSAAPVEASPAR